MPGVAPSLRCAPRRLYSFNMRMPGSTSNPFGIPRLSSPVLFLLLLACTAACRPHSVNGLTEEAAAAVKIPGIVVITDEFYPPYIMRTESGGLEGILVDLWAAWERVTGVPVEIRTYSWSEAQERFSRGEGDVIDTIFDTPERRRYLVFSPPYARIPVPVFTHSSITGIASPEDLRGFRIAVKSGDAAVAELVRLGVSDLSLYKSYKEIIEAASRHEVRIFCVDGPPAYHYLYKLGIDRDFRQAFILNQGAFSRAVRLGNESLLNTIQRGFDGIPPSEIRAIERRWMGSELPRSPNWRLIGGGAAAASLLLTFLAGITLNLRRRVETATRELKEKILLLESSEARNLQALREKEVLLQEIHHRVKNNLQIISSLLRLQAEDLDSPEARELFQGTQSRIFAMADLHDRLYTSGNLERIDAGEYVQNLVHSLATTFNFYGFVCDARPVHLNIEEALPLGLIVNECAINALKYAYQNRDPGTIEIGLYQENGECVCSVRDFGRGIPDRVDPYVASSLGFTIVRSLAEQIRGRVRFDSSAGFSVEVRFPLPKDKENPAASG